MAESRRYVRLPKAVPPERPRLRPIDPKEQAVLRSLLGRRCAVARQELGISGRAMARLMGRSGTWIREVEGGEQYAPWYYVVALAEATGTRRGGSVGSG